MTGGKQTKEQFPYRHFGEEGTGYYSANSKGCFLLMDQITPLVLEAIEAAEFDPQEGRPFTICDFGTADGGTSMSLMMQCIERIREEYGKTTEVNILYEDQPINDFKSLMLRVNGLLPGNPTYLDRHDNVYFSAVGVGFYKQCCPTNSLHLAFSSNAMHYLSKRPCTLTEAIHHTQATRAEEKEKIAAQAAKDWETILQHRAKELAPGGKMVIAGLCTDEQGRCNGTTSKDTRSMFGFMGKLFRQMVNSGRITEDEFQNIMVNSCYRTVEEYLAPFTDTTSPVYEAGLRLDQWETHLVPCPYHEKWMSEGKKGDPQAMRAHAKWYIPCMRNWLNMQFVSGLSDMRSQEERETIIGEFFQLYEDDVAKNPDIHKMERVEIFMVVSKLKYQSIPALR